MVAKTESSFLLSEERFTLIREILGICLGLASVLMFLSLLSARNGATWIGPFGSGIAFGLDFVFGVYVAFVFPGLMAMIAFQMLRGQTPLVLTGTGWLRGVGGVMILFAACALLTLTAQARGGDAFLMGGTLGNLLIDQHGLALSRRMGAVGAAVLFSGLALIGLVLFTEKFLRDLVKLLWQGIQAGGVLASEVRWFARIGDALHAALVAPFGRFFQALFACHPIQAVRDLLAGIEFGRDGSAQRVMGHAPARSITEESTEAPAPRRGGIFGSLRGAEPAARSGRVFGGGVPLHTPREPEGLLDIDALLAGTAPRTPRPAPEPELSFEAEVPQDGAEYAGPTHEAAAKVSPLEPGVAIEKLLPRVEPPRDTARPRTTPVQPEMTLFPAEFQLPSASLLADPPTTQYHMSEAERESLSRKIEATLETFRVEVQVVEVVQGPTITRFALKVAAGVRVNKITALESELAMALKAPHVRILAPIPGQAAVGIEVPNKRPNLVVFKELLQSEEFQASRSPLSFALGKNIAGETVICDLAKMPHLLIAGATGAGKSVCLNTIIASMLYRNTPDKVKFVMVDPKRVELSIYQAIPHLIAPVVSETKKAAAALAWCVEQMEQRYRTLAEIGVRNLDGYNAILNDRQPNKKSLGRDLKFMPHIVIIIDELADLMMVAKNEVEEYIIRLAQMARAVGIHLILATQRPSVNVITGIIKANFPSRIAFQVSSKVDSRTILDANGAESLLGRGDMLYSPGGAKPFRIQGAFVSDAEVERLADFIRDQEKARYEKEDFEVRPTPAERAKANLTMDEDGASLSEHFDDETGQPIAMATRGRAGSGNAPLPPGDLDAMSDEELYNMALRLVLETRKGSVSYIQRRMKIGYARAGRIMDMMEEQGIVGPYQGSKPRDVLVDPAEYLARLG